MLRMEWNGPPLAFPVLSQAYNFLFLSEVDGLTALNQRNYTWRNALPGLALLFFVFRMFLDDVPTCDRPDRARILFGISGVTADKERQGFLNDLSRPPPPCAIEPLRFFPSLISDLRNFSFCSSLVVLTLTCHGAEELAPPPVFARHRHNFAREGGGKWWLPQQKSQHGSLI